jgi:hypothetical protein
VKGHDRLLEAEKRVEACAELLPERCPHDFGRDAALLDQKLADLSTPVARERQREPAMDPRIQ